MKVRFIGETDEMEYYTHGKIYEVDCIDSGYYIIEDADGDLQFCDKSEFVIIEGSEEELDVYETDPKTFEPVLVKKGNKPRQ